MVSCFLQRSDIDMLVLDESSLAERDRGKKTKENTITDLSSSEKKKKSEKNTQCFFLYKKNTSASPIQLALSLLLGGSRLCTFEKGEAGR